MKNLKDAAKRGGKKAKGEFKLQEEELTERHELELAAYERSTSEAHVGTINEDADTVKAAPQDGGKIKVCSGGRVT
jgi:hypothetical protein